MTLPLDSADLAAIWLTLKLASLTTLVLLLIGTPLAWALGRTDLPGGSGRDLLESIVTKLLVLDDDTLVLPGHGERSTIGLERRTNPFLEGLTP